MTNDDISDEDKKLFRESMRNVTPLKQSKVYKHPPLPKTPPLPRRRHEPDSRPLQYDLSNHYTKEVGPETVLSYHVQGIQKKRLIELRKGMIPLEGRLDLHGLTTVQAQDRLCQFITQQHLAGHRCVLIIHGKGSPTGEAPILKNHVNHWLKQLPHILAFQSALPRDGGSGALYALLKRGVTD